jgi:hypothetical protein
MCTLARPRPRSVAGECRGRVADVTRWFLGYALVVGSRLGSYNVRPSMTDSHNDKCLRLSAMSNVSVECVAVGQSESVRTRNTRNPDDTVASKEIHRITNYTRYTTVRKISKLLVSK